MKVKVRKNVNKKICHQENDSDSYIILQNEAKPYWQEVSLRTPASKLLSRASLSVVSRPIGAKKE